MELQLPANVLTAIKLLNDHGYEAFVVGGAIRNHLLNLPIYDFDLTTSATPEEMKEVFANYKVIETGIKHGTLTIHIDHLPLEITTYRIEKEYLDHRHPSVVEFTRNLKEDLGRRDFTINALAYHPSLGIVDYYGGLKDIEDGIIRAIHEPCKRFDEDALRIMRALRFKANLGFEIEEMTAKAMHEQKELLNYISAERIHDELCRTLCGEYIFSTLMDYKDILATIIPEFEMMLDCPHDNPHHIYDVYTHTAHVVEHTPAKVNLRMAALLHDLGKPYVKTFDASHIAHYKGHALKSYELSKKILKRLKFSSEDAKNILTLILYHDDYMKNTKASLKHFLREFGPATTYQLLDLQIADNMAKSNVFDCSEIYGECHDLIDEILANKECYSLQDLAIKGADVIALGIEGANISIALNAALDAVIAEEVANEKAALIQYIKHQVY